MTSEVKVTFVPLTSLDKILCRLSGNSFSTMLTTFPRFISHFSLAIARKISKMSRSTCDSFLRYEFQFFKIQSKEESFENYESNLLKFENLKSTCLYFKILN